MKQGDFVSVQIYSQDIENAQNFGWSIGALSNTRLQLDMKFERPEDVSLDED